MVQIWMNKGTISFLHSMTNFSIQKWQILKLKNYPCLDLIPGSLDPQNSALTNPETLPLKTAFLFLTKSNPRCKVFKTCLNQSCLILDERNNFINYETNHSGSELVLLGLGMKVGYLGGSTICRFGDRLNTGLVWYANGLFQQILYKKSHKKHFSFVWNSLG